MASLEDSNALLIFRVGPVFCCALSLPVEAIIQPPHLTHPPGSSASRPGIFKHGQHLVSVVDLRHRFGVEERNRTHPGRMIITQLENGRIGFWVDQIIDVIEMPQQGWGRLPPHLPRGVFSRTLLLNNVIHLYAEFVKLATLEQAGYLRDYIKHLEQQQTKPEVDTPADKNKYASRKQPEIKTTATRIINSADKSTTSEPVEPVKAAATENITSFAVNRPQSTQSPRQTEITETGETTATPSASIKSSTHRFHSDNRGTPSSATQHLDVNPGSRISPDIKPKTRPKANPLTHSGGSNTVTSNSVLSTHSGTTSTQKKSDQPVRQDKPVILNTATKTGTSPDTSFAHRLNNRLDNRHSPASVTKTHLATATTKTSHATTRPVSNANVTVTGSASNSATSEFTRDTAYRDDREESSGDLTFAIIAMLLMLFLAGGTYYILFSDNNAFPEYASDQTSAIPELNRPRSADTFSDVASSRSEYSTSRTAVPESVRDTDVTQRQNTEENDISSQHGESQQTQGKAAASATDNILPDISDKQEITSLASTTYKQHSNPDRARVTTNENDGSGYRASIEKDQDEITIYLTEPVTGIDVPVNPEKTTTETPVVDSEQIQTGDITPADHNREVPAGSNKKSTIVQVQQQASTGQIKQAKDISLQPLNNKNISGRRIIKVTHIVVKGDTLWHIAKRYVKNPYLYPELARLSHIKNPDLIYPGDRVHIIRYRP